MSETAVLTYKMARKLQTNWQLAGCKWLFSPALFKPNGSLLFYSLRQDNPEKYQRKLYHINQIEFALEILIFGPAVFKTNWFAFYSIWFCCCNFIDEHFESIKNVCRQQKCLNFHSLCNLLERNTAWMKAKSLRESLNLDLPKDLG